MRNLFLVLAVLLINTATAQQKQIQYLSGIDAAHTVQWDFFCTADRRWITCFN